MDKFLALTEEKRTAILNAALQCFGKFGYEKASINDIAVAAHISKASVFQYFGSKKESFQNQPFILQFITSVWEETSPEVADALVILTEEVCKFRNDMVLREDDALKFKNPEDAQPVFQMLLLMAEGYAARYRGAAAFDFQAVMEDFEENIAILRKNFYKEEYQK